MLSRLVKAMNALSQDDKDDDDPSINQHSHRRSSTHNNGRELRKSARLHSRRNGNGGSVVENEVEKEESIHDSGTESDEEEMETIARRRHYNNYDPLATWRNNDKFLNRGSPPALSSTPPIPRDVDTESWNSFGRESGIMTGDNDSDTDGAATPTPNRRRMKNAHLKDDDTSSTGAEKRRYSDTMDDHPIAWRLRSFNTIEPVRPMKIAARRIPVRVIINHPPSDVKMHAADEEVALPELGPAPAPKRNRRNSHRPSLDFDKMVETRLDTEILQKPVTRSQLPS